MRLLREAVEVVAATALGTLLLIGICEGAARLLLPFPAASHATYVSSPRTLYQHRPSSSGWEVSPVGEFPPAHVRYNAHGLRGAEMTTLKPNGEVRIALLGDSMVEARQVSEEQTFARLLETKLQHGRGSAVRVINAGVSAYTTTTANLLLREKVLPLAPDVVVYLFFANDYSDNFSYGNYSQYPRLLMGEVPAALVPRIEVPPLANAPLEWTRRRSAFASWLLSIRDRQVTEQALARPEPTLANVSKSIALPATLTSLSLRLRRKPCWITPTKALRPWRTPAKREE